MSDRVIKFRVWDIKEKRMFIVYGLNITIKYISEYRDTGDEIVHNFDDCIFMQFTGLLDKNGKEIYEKDLIKFKCVRDDVNEGIVEWNESGAYWTIKAKLPVMLHRAENVEVIGNEFENAK
jgi:uncharacterized phage protein (TIGR01671 family)